MTPLRICIECPALCRGTRCPVHEREYQRARNAKVRYRRTYRWQQLSKAVIAASPVCAHCGATEDLTCDHVRPRDATELQVLCRSCNGRKADR